MSILNMFTSNNFLSEANKTDSIKDGEKKEDPNMITAEDEDNKKKKNDDTDEGEDSDDEAFDDVDSEVDSFDEPSKLKSHSPDDLSPDDNTGDDDIDGEENNTDLDDTDSSDGEDDYDDSENDTDNSDTEDDTESIPDPDDTEDDSDSADSDSEDSYDDTGEGEDDLSQDDTEKNKLKLKKLLDDYFDLYSFINEMINSFENINEKDKIEFSIFSKISDNLQSLKYSINDYINIRFTKSSYEENLAMYYKITNSVKITDKIISNIIENRNKH